MKNIFKLFALIFMMFPVLAGCSSKGETITYWNALTGPDGDYMTELVDAFNEEYDGTYYVEQSIIPGEDLTTKLTVASGNTDNLPDIALIDNTIIPQMADAGVITSMEDTIASMGLEADSFIPGAWLGAEYDGEMYGIPFDSYIFFLYYNIDILTELGYTEDDVWNLTNEEAIAMTQEAVDAGYNGWAMYQAYPWPEIFYGYLAALGGNIVDPDDSTVPGFNTEEGLAALEAFYSPYVAGVTNDPSIDGVIEFQQGNTLFKYDGIWANTSFTGEEIQEEGVNIGVAPLPSVDEDTDNMYFTGSHNLTVVEKEYSEEQSAGMEAFMAYLLENSGDFSAAGQIPANMDAWDNETFQSQTFYEVAIENADNFVYAPSSVYFGTIAGEIGASITGLIDGTYSSMEEAFDTAEKKATDQIAAFESGETTEEVAEE